MYSLPVKQASITWSGTGGAGPPNRIIADAATGLAFAVTIASCLHLDRSWFATGPFIIALVGAVALNVVRVSVGIPRSLWKIPASTLKIGLLSVFAAVAFHVGLEFYSLMALFWGFGIAMEQLLPSVHLGQTHVDRGEIATRAAPPGVEYNGSLTSMLRALALAASTRDDETHEHSKRVAELAHRLASSLGMPPSEVAAVYWAAIVHDIGKVVVPRSILKKPGTLVGSEFEVVKNHSQAGADILRSVHPDLRDIALLVLHHHERWDGTGYPTASSGLAIPLGARIIAVADTFEALTSDRPYRKALSQDEAIDVIRAGASTQFDPDVTQLFLRLMNDELQHAITPSYSWAAGQAMALFRASDAKHEGAVYRTTGMATVLS